MTIHGSVAAFAGLLAQVDADGGAGLTGWIQANLGLTPTFQFRVFWSVVAIVLLWLLRTMVMRVVTNRARSARARYNWAKASAYIAFVLGILVITQIWLSAILELGTFLGLASAGLAIALRDVVANLAGWGFILWRRPFELGDRIQIGSQAGDVVDLRLFQFSILEIGNWVAADQSTGRVIHIPNARVFTESLANYTVEFPYVWHEVAVLVTFESDWRKAKEILKRIADDVGGPVVEDAQDAVRRASRKFLIHYRYLTPIVYTSVEDSGVLLTLRFLSPVRSRRGLTEAIWEGILEAFHREADIDLAYPTQRVYHNLLEGKVGARAEPPGWIRRTDGFESEGS